MTTTTHVLMDLDGTISDSSPGITRSLLHAFAVCGLDPPTEQQVHSIIGPPFEIGLPRLGVAPSDVEPVVSAYRDRYEDVGLFENEVYDGIPELLAALAAEMTLVVATAKPETTATRIVEHFGLSDHFASVVGATMAVGSARRSKAQVIRHALDVLEVDPSPAVMMVGDRDHDVEGARENGLECVGVTWGFGSADELRTAGAARVVDSPADVAAALTSTYREPLS